MIHFSNTENAIAILDFIFFIVNALPSITIVFALLALKGDSSNYRDSNKEKKP